MKYCNKDKKGRKMCEFVPVRYIIRYFYEPSISDVTLPELIPSDYENVLVFDYHLALPCNKTVPSLSVA